MATPTLNLVGAGRVGRTLARLWTQSGSVRLQAVLCQSEASGQSAVRAIGAGQAVTSLVDMPPADLWLLAVPDSQIAAVAADLAALPLAQQAALAWHCSGFLPASTLAPLQALGWAASSAHPALSFAEPARAAAQFPGTVCALEGDAPAVAAARQAFEALGGRCFDLQAADKPLYHGAAVFASNFLPVLQAVAQELWQGTGVPPQWVSSLAHGFLQQVSDNVQALGPRAALTGPAARGDAAVLAQQGAAMTARDPVLGEAYRSLSALAGRLASQGQTLAAPTPPPGAA
jgi:predicted short-subunit dehydrogenase-like oxidoreductase (DUF2520 family)